MSFEYCGAGDLPPTALSGLEEFGFLPYIIAGSAAVGATIAAWLSNNNWSTGEYNYWMRSMNDAITQWDKAGWTNGCWAKDPTRRTAWLSFWKRFSEHYAEHGNITGFSIPPVALDSEEKPARLLMQELANWGDWLNATCGDGTANAGLLDPSKGTGKSPIPPPEAPTDWGSIVKWGGIGLGAIALMSVVANIRGAFGTRA